MPAGEFLFENFLPVPRRDKSYGLYVRIDHDFYQFPKGDFGLPTELFFGLGRISLQNIYLRGPKVSGIDLHVIPPVQTHIRKGFFYKLPDRVGLSRADHIVVRLVLLQHPPHRLDVFRRIAPVPPCVQVSQIERILFSGQDVGDRPADLAAYKGFTPPWTLVVKQNAITGKQVIAFSIVDRHPIGIEFGCRVRASGSERGGFVLGRRGAPEHLGARRLIEAGRQPAAVNRVQDARGAEARIVAGVFGHLETHLDMGLRAQMVDLVRPDVVNQVCKLLHAGEVSIMEEQPRVRVMEVLIEMVDAAGVERAGPADEAVDLVALGKQQFGKIRPVLPGNAGDEGAAFGHLVWLVDLVHLVYFVCLV